MRTRFIYFLTAFFVLRCDALGQWIQTSGPSGGQINAFAVSGTNIYSATERDGVFRSTDGGTSWSRLHPVLANYNIKALAVSGINIIAGASGYWGGGVFFSADSGLTWTLSNNGLANTNVNTLAVYGNSLFAGTDGGVFRSSDEGAHWIAVNKGLTNTTVTALAVCGMRLLTATYGGGVFLLSDGDTSWSAANTGLPGSAQYLYALTAVGTTLFTGTLWDGIYRSTDYGATWTAVWGQHTQCCNGWTVYAFAVSGTNILAGSDAGICLSTDNGGTWTWANEGLGPTQPHTFQARALLVDGNKALAGIAGRGIFRSSLPGFSWSYASTGLANTVVLSVAVNGTNVYAGTDIAGLFLSTDNGAYWTPIGFAGLQIPALAVCGTDLYVGSLQGIFRSSDGGGSWTQVNNGKVLCFAVSGTIVFAGTLGSGVVMTTDGGSNWIDRNGGLLVGRNVTALALSGTTLYAGTDGPGIFRSSDIGASWIAVNNGLPASVGVSALAVSGTYLFEAMDHYGVYRSTDGGASWKPAQSGLTASERCFAVTNSGIFAGSEYGVSLSTNNGTSWREVSSDGMANTSVRTLMASGADLFAGTYGRGVFRRPIMEMTAPVQAPAAISPVDGAINQNLTVALSWHASTWAKSYRLQVAANAAFTDPLIDDSTIVDTSSVIGQLKYATTYFWRISAANRFSKSEASTAWSFTTASPSIFSLAQNFPNPFNSSTEIVYQLPEVGDVNLAVYDVLGREVTVLVNGSKPAGVHSVRFDGKNIASGLYVYRLKAGSYVASKKMVVVK